MELDYKKLKKIQGKGVFIKTKDIERIEIDLTSKKNSTEEIIDGLCYLFSLIISALFWKNIKTIEAKIEILPIKVFEDIPFEELINQFIEAISVIISVQNANLSTSIDNDILTIIISN